MSKYVVNEVAGKRDLTFQYKNGDEVKAFVIIGVPAYVEDKDYYQCPYELDVDGHKRTFAICGMDSLQAIALTFKALDAEIEMFAKQNKGEFLFYGEKYHTLLDPEWKENK
jgi:predicted nucleic acid-binding Zn finger protein